jgi:hypothetical protein
METSNGIWVCGPHLDQKKLRALHLADWLDKDGSRVHND